MQQSTETATCILNGYNNRVLHERRIDNEMKKLLIIILAIFLTITWNAKTSLSDSDEYTVDCLSFYTPVIISIEDIDRLKASKILQKLNVETDNSLDKILDSKSLGLFEQALQKIDGSVIIFNAAMIPSNRILVHQFHGSTFRFDGLADDQSSNEEQGSADIPGISMSLEIYAKNSNKNTVVVRYKHEIVLQNRVVKATSSVGESDMPPVMRYNINEKIEALLNQWNILSISILENPDTEMLYQIWTLFRARSVTQVSNNVIK
jgi:hypothetical protein